MPEASLGFQAVSEVQHSADTAAGAAAMSYQESLQLPGEGLIVEALSEMQRPWRHEQQGRQPSAQASPQARLQQQQLRTPVAEHQPGLETVPKPAAAGTNRTPAAQPAHPVQHPGAELMLQPQPADASAEAHPPAQPITAPQHAGARPAVQTAADHLLQPADHAGSMPQAQFVQVQPSAGPSEAQAQLSVLSQPADSAASSHQARQTLAEVCSAAKPAEHGIPALQSELSSAETSESQTVLPNASLVDAALQELQQPSAHEQPATRQAGDQQQPAHGAQIAQPSQAVVVPHAAAMPAAQPDLQQAIVGLQAPMEPNTQPGTEDRCGLICPCSLITA